MRTSTLPDPAAASLRATRLTAKARRGLHGHLGQRWARKQVLKRLDRIQTGHLQVTVTREQGPEEVLHFGSPGSHGPAADIQVRDPRFWSMLVTGGALGAAEAYAEGWWDSFALVDVIRLFARNRAVLSSIDGGWARWSAPLLRRIHQANRNTRVGSRRNIEAHYDLSNEFFSLFLDPTMTYSCGLFRAESATLEEAQLAKIDHLCRKLALGPEHHLLEIGTGWGALARHAAQHYGCRVTTTTLSREQHAWAERIVAEAGLGDRVTLLLQDYRSLEGEFDRVVSVEMIEAVGADFLGEYFATVGRLLKPDGIAAIQAITIQDQEFERASRHVDFIKRYIFPGSCIPSVTAMCNAMTEDSDLKLVDLEDFTPDYARTLDHWAEALEERHEEAKAMGLDDRFLRTWEYYFRYCEGGFAERQTGLVQMMLAKPGGAWSPYR